LNESRRGAVLGKRGLCMAAGVGAGIVITHRPDQNSEVLMY
jgi:hypothetical protein